MALVAASRVRKTLHKKFQPSPPSPFRNDQGQLLPPPPPSPPLAMQFTALANLALAGVALATPVALHARDLNSCVTGATYEQQVCTNKCQQTDGNCIQACVDKSTGTIRACLSQYPNSSTVPSVPISVGTVASA